MAHSLRNSTIRTMSNFFHLRVSWRRVIFALLWSCLPAFLFYLLVLQLPFISLSRLGLAVLLIPLLALIAYRTIPRMQALVRRDWAILILVSMLYSAVVSFAFSSYPEKTYLFSPQHTLKIDVTNFVQGQNLVITRFQTSLGDVSLSSFRDLAGWNRSGTSLTPASILYMILLGASLYLLVNVALNSQKRFSPNAEPYLPTWAGYALIAGGLLGAAILAWKVRSAYIELLWVLTLSLLWTTPAYMILRAASKTRLGQIESYFQAAKIQKYAPALIVLCSFLLAFILFSPSIHTNWNLVDDDEIRFFLGPGGTLPFSSLFQKLQLTEIGQIGIVARFRPAYYFLRLLESVLWGAHPLYWHIFRIILLALSICLFWAMISPTLGWLAGGLLCAYALTFVYWGDVIARLGPSETYTVVGLPIFIWGVLRGLQAESTSGKREYLAGCAVLLGGVICVGSKENFLLLVLPLFYLAYKTIRTRKIVLFFFTLGTLLFAGYVAGGALLAIRTYGQTVDVYGNSVLPQTRIGIIWGVLQQEWQSVPLSILAGLICAVALMFFQHGLSKENRRSITQALLWLAACLFVYLSQLFFYDGLWPIGYRYDFPGLLYIPAAITIVFSLIRKMAVQWTAGAAAVLKTSLILALFIVILSKSYDPLFQFQSDNNKSADQFNQGLAKLVSVLNEHPDYALVVESGSSSDLSPAIGYARFLHADGVNNEVFLRIHGYSVQAPPPGEDWRSIFTIVNTSIQGDRYFLPLDKLQGFGNKCYSLTFSGSFKTECQPLN